MNFKIVTDSSSNIFSMEDASFSSVPLKIITDQKEFVDDPQLNLEEMLSYLASYKGRRHLLPQYSGVAGRLRRRRRRICPDHHQQPFRLL